MKKLFVTGIGPGKEEEMTARARASLEAADLLCGYTGYIKLIAELYPDKEVLATPMMQELARCRAALEAADQGKTVTMICSGDAGVYGMASPILELAPEFPQVEIEIVTGVTAALSGAAVLGAPLNHDFAVISLSDLLTPWGTIFNRLKAAAEADFAICLYNPSSHKRADYLQKACDILLSYLPPDRTCGWARNIGREGQEKGLLTLKALRDFPADMFTTVFIGNSTTRIISGRMVTPRGYQNQARSQEKNDSENGPADKGNVQESPLGSSQESLRQSSQEGLRGPKEGSGSNRRDKGRGDAKGTGK